MMSLALPSGREEEEESFFSACSRFALYVDDAGVGSSELTGLVLPFVASCEVDTSLEGGPVHQKLQGEWVKIEVSNFGAGAKPK